MAKKNLKWEGIKESSTSAVEYKTDFQTPPEICKYMVSLIPQGVKTVLEPTPGIGNIVTELRRTTTNYDELRRTTTNYDELRRTTTNYDVIVPEDFFLLPKEDRYDCIVMNPPFSSKFTILDNAPEGYNKSGMRMGYYILTECMNRSNNVIALMPWFTISDSDVRLRSLKRYGLKSVTALPRRTFEYARIQTVVLELQRGFTGETIFKVYDCLNDKDQYGIF